MSAWKMKFWYAFMMMKKFENFLERFYKNQK